MVLDNGTLSFATDPHEGMAYLVKEGVLEDCSMAYARFIHGTDALHWPSLGTFLEERLVHVHVHLTSCRCRIAGHFHVIVFREF